MGETNESSENQAIKAATFLGMAPFGVLVAEAILGVLIFGLSMMFIATVFLAFVGFILWYVGAWIAVVFSMLGVVLSVAAITTGPRLSGRPLGGVFLIVHAGILCAAGGWLIHVHSVGEKPSMATSNFGEPGSLEASFPAELSHQQLQKAFKNVSVGMTQEEIVLAVSVPGRLVEELYDWSVGDGSAGVSIEKGTVVGFWSSGGNSHWVEGLELNMLEGDARQTLGDAPVTICPIYQWGDPPFRVSFCEGKAFRVSQPNLDLDKVFDPQPPVD